MLTGAFRRDAITIDVLEWVADAPKHIIEQIIVSNEFIRQEENENIIHVKTSGNLSIRFLLSGKENLINKYFQHNCSDGFYNAFINKFPSVQTKIFATEEDIFTNNQLQFIPAYLERMING